MLVMRLAPRQRIAPMNSVLRFFHVGRVNSGENTAKTDIISGVIIGNSLSLIGFVNLKTLGLSAPGRLLHIRADIKLFYKAIPHHQLVQDIKQHYHDEKVQTMLSQIIVNPIETPRGYKNPDHGIALRGPLSQFFSGIYLKPLDDAFNTMDVTYLRYQDDILILCYTKRQLQRCKQRMMAVLKERQLRLSRKKTRIGCIEKGFHFLGIHYPGTQTPDNTNMAQAIDRSAIQVDVAHYMVSLRGGGQILQLNIKRLMLRTSSHIQGRCEKHVSKLKQWSILWCLPAGSEIICIDGLCGG